ncbi:MAG: CHAT domain-containing protein, partial [Rubrobacteraceae bacterium]
PQSRLENAEKHHEVLREIVDAERMFYVAGYDRPTFYGIEDFSRLDDLDAYDVTLKGDGTVPHELGLLDDVKTYYVDEEHGNLAINERVLASLDELLQNGSTDGLIDRLPARRRGEESEEEKEAARRRLIASLAADEERLRVMADRNSVRSSRSDASYVSGDEREMEEIVVRGFLGSSGGEGGEEEKVSVPFGPSSIEIGLVCGGIESLPYAELTSEDGSPVDALAVGHYINVKPREAELALDCEISAALSGKSVSELSESDLLITRYFERGIVRGRLGQPFFLPDPRDDGDRVIALAGMGLPGGFGVPELTVLARELCWSLGRMEKKHLGTVLIGAGNGNIPTGDAVSAWMRGIKHAITGSFEDEGRRLLRITFVEKDPFKAAKMAEAILIEKTRLEESDRLKVDFHAPDREELERKKAEERQRRQSESMDERGDEDLPPTRVTLSLDGNRYRFGAITDTAAIPEREVVIDPDLVMSANDELASESEPSLQLERGRFLEKLLVPRELRSRFSTGAPVVMMLDSTVARIHWEMVAQPDLLERTEGEDDGDSNFDPDRFLGTSRGFTRQIKTTFAPPPEPPPPPRRLMRVLVIADPAEDARLPGAEEEGVEVADLFESFNSVHKETSQNRVEVVRLFGPYEATRTTVMRHLMLRSYDVVHFAGHCVYDGDDPASSGWIFSNGKRLSASELGRIDRVPGFVFSNACESGITPDRSGMRSADLAPSFAEAFFERGVTNFVCTAWPVDDLAAREFARTLYSALLGMNGDPKAMHTAMREARLAISDSPSGALTWGAYQHYGSPYFRFFDPENMTTQGP